jgi:hypothetical protein
MALVKNVLKDYTTKGIFVADADAAWKMSTSWLETCFLQNLAENDLLKSTLMICKHYNERIFPLKWPCMKAFFQHQIKVLRDELLTVIPHSISSLEILKTYNPHSNLCVEMMIYNAVSDWSCIPEKGYVIKDYETDLSTLQAACKDRMIDFLADISKTSLHPALAELNNEQIIPLVSTVSTVFKALVLKEFASSNPARNISVDPVFILKVLTRYVHLVQTDGWVEHPLLGDKIQVRKAKCHTDHVYMPSLHVGQILNSHSVHVTNIVGQLQQCLIDS